MTTSKLIQDLREELREKGSEAVRLSTRRFFKEEIQCYGLQSSEVQKIIARSFKQVNGMGKERVFALCEELLLSDYSEEASIAFEWSYRFREEYLPEDMKTFERWLSHYVNNWAKCDILCNHTIGSFVELYPSFLGKLSEWAISPNRWLRRGAAVTLILPARKGLFLKEVFAIADALLTDGDDLVQKGYGWALKEASRVHGEEVFHYILEHRGEMPRTALRYAIEKMPPEMRKEAMKR